MSVMQKCTAYPDVFHYMQVDPKLASVFLSQTGEIKTGSCVKGSGFHLKISSWFDTHRQ